MNVVDIVVADDEPLARSTLISMLLELGKPAVRIVGEAKSGRELIELVKQYTPDVVFVDIRMPLLNGLESIEKGKSVSPLTQWVILSGYSEFEYARQALRLGVTNYLLKPAAPEDVERSLAEAVERQKQSVSALNRDFENHLMSLFQSNRRPEHPIGFEPFQMLRLIGYLLYLDSPLPNNEKAHLETRLTDEIWDNLHRLSPKEIRVARITLQKGETVFIFGYNLFFKEKLRYFLEKIEFTISQITLKYENHFVFGTWGRSEECEGPKNLIEQIEEARNIGSLRIFFPGKPIRLISEWRKERQNDEKIFLFSTLIDRLSIYYHEKNYLNFVKLINLFRVEWKSFFHPENPWRPYIDRHLKRAIGFAVRPTDTAADWFKKGEAFGEELLQSSNYEERFQKGLVEQVKAYVDENYMHDIGIGQIACQLGITPNYLSSLFHKKCGMTFMKYLTNTRMLKAKELLMTQPHLPIREVASSVGYYSVRYFTKQFEKHFGCLPSEMRRNASGGPSASSAASEQIYTDLDE